MMASICFVAERSDGQAAVPAAETSLWNHCLALLCPVLHQDQVTRFVPDTFVSAFRADKKHSPDHFHLIVPARSSAATSLGVEEIRLPATGTTLNAILAAMQAALAALAALGTDNAYSPTTR